MKRRDFVQQSAFAGSLFLVNPSFIMRHKPKQIGVQLWSVRDAADIDPKGTLEQLAAMGYAEVEGYKYEAGKFYTYTPAEFKNVMQDIGIRMTSAHTGIHAKHWDAASHALSDLGKRTIEDHAALGVQQLICPHIDEDWRTSDHLKQLCEIFNHVGETCQQMGIQFGYHNHDFEFKKLEGKYVMDHILGQTDSRLVTWEMDLYWVRYAHEDPATWLHQYGKRVSAFHVKDMANTPRRESIEIGQGVIDFGSLFKLRGASHARYYIVELEDYKTTSMEGVRTCLKGLKQILSNR